MFRKNVHFEYYIYPPRDVSAVTKGMSLVLDLMMDTKETAGGEDYVQIHAFGKYEDCKFRYTGKENITMRYKVSEIFKDKYGTALDIGFYRSYSDDNFDKWENKRITGMAVKWYYENEIGKKMNIEGNTSNLSGRKEYFRNTAFVTLTDIVIHAITEDNVTEEEVWKDAKRFRQEWLKNVQYKAPSMCKNEMVNNDIVWGHIVEQETKYKITVNTQMYKEKVTEALLQTTAKIYIFLLNCPDLEMISWNKFYEDLFMNFPARFILQTVMDIYGLHTGEELKRNIHENLLEKLDELFNFDYHKLDMVFDTSSDLKRKLENGKVKRYKNKIRNCLFDLKCEEITKLTNSIGGFQML